MMNYESTISLKYQEKLLSDLVFGVTRFFGACEAPGRGVM
jgi:hypothetical protein